MAKLCIESRSLKVTGEENITESVFFEVLEEMFSSIYPEHLRFKSKLDIESKEPYVLNVYFDTNYVVLKVGSIRVTFSITCKYILRIIRTILDDLEVTEKHYGFLTNIIFGITSKQGISLILCDETRKITCIRGLEDG